jgi:hypothetical protein
LGILHFRGDLVVLVLVLVLVLELVLENALGLRVELPIDKRNRRLSPVGSPSLLRGRVRCGRGFAALWPLWPSV